MHWACPNPNTPRLGIRQTLEQSIGSTQTIIANFKFTCLDVDCDNLAPVVWLNLKPDRGFIERIPPLGEFLFAISGLSDCHRFDLAATSPVYFSLERR
jgi:hypothetical protein